MKIMSYKLFVIACLTILLGAQGVLLRKQIDQNPHFEVPVAQSITPTAAASVPTIERTNGNSFPDLDEFSIVATRTVFRESRKPFQLELQPVLKPEFAPQTNPKKEIAKVEPFEAELIGVVMTSDKTIALLQSDGLPNLIRLTYGDVYQGWSVVSVEADSVIFEANGQKKIIRVNFRN